MPFKSVKQRGYLYAKKPKIAKKWAKKYGGKVKSDKKLRENVLRARAS